MKVNLIKNGSLEAVDMAICKCHDREWTSCNYSRIDRVGNKLKHASVLEHCTYTFDIVGISRALLQEISRHRISSPTVKSSRYTLDELKKESPFVTAVHFHKKEDKYTSLLARNAMVRASKYIVFTGNQKVDSNNIVKLDMLRNSVQQGIENDFSKFEIPECYKTSLVWTLNARSLQNLFKLRSHSSALWEFIMLVNKMMNEIPEHHKFLFEDCFNHDYVEVRMSKEQYKDWQNTIKDGK